LYGPADHQTLTEDVLGHTHWFINDAQQTVRKVIQQDSGGSSSPVCTLDYDPFGDPTANPSGAPRQRYTGQMYDMEDGLAYYGARFYDPAVGRFINQDPARARVNWYAYVGNNPMNLIDPMGLDDVNVPDTTDPGPSEGAPRDDSGDIDNEGSPENQDSPPSEKPPSNGGDLDQLLTRKPTKGSGIADQLL